MPWKQGTLESALFEKASSKQELEERQSFPEHKKEPEMPVINFEYFTYPVDVPPTAADIRRLQKALLKLKFPISKPERGHVKLGDSTREALRAFQGEFNLTVDGELNTATVNALRLELAHQHFANNKTRVARLHDMLVQLGYSINATELKNRQYGSTTMLAVQNFFKLPKGQTSTVDPRMTPERYNEIEDAVFALRFTTTTQIAKLHEMLIQAIAIAKLQGSISLADRTLRRIGDTTKAVIAEFQTKYGLTITTAGKINGETFARLQSVVASILRKPLLQKLKAPAAVNLTAIPKNKILRMNMKGEAICSLQRTLAHLGYAIAQEEFDTQTFGKTTYIAVKDFQRARGLENNGHVKGETLEALRAEILKKNPHAEIEKPVYRVRGSVRDDLWKGKPGVTVRVFEKTATGETLLAERETLKNGFYDATYDPPQNSKNGQIKNPFYLLIRVLDENGEELGTKTLFNPSPTAWANFTDGNLPYRGRSEFEGHKGKLAQGTIEGLGAAPGEKKLTSLSRETGVDADVLMKLDLAQRIATIIDDPLLTSDVFYMFLAQGLPSELPSDLLKYTKEWTAIDELAQTIAQGIVLLAPDAQNKAFKRAVKKNLIPIETIRRREEILEALKAKRLNLALNAPLLGGTGTFGDILQMAQLSSETAKSKLAELYLAHGGLDDAFWNDPKLNEVGLNLNTISQLKSWTTLGVIAGNHQPFTAFLKGKIETSGTSQFKKVSDFAKLDLNGWKDLIDQSNEEIPAHIEGSTPDEKKAAFAASVLAESQRCFPSIALAAEVGRGSDHGLTRLSEASQVLDAYPDLDMEKINLHQFVRSNKFALDNMFTQYDTIWPAVFEDLKALQRVQRMSPEPTVGRALLEEGFGNSAAVVFAGETRVVERLTSRGVSASLAAEAYNRAHFQYAQVVDRIIQYRCELNRISPAALVDRTYSPQDLTDVLKDIPDLEALFGANDLNDCDENNSVWGAPAYLADILRFLGELNSEPVGNETVLEVLFERRPDIQHIKLNRENTETTLPYIDLVCEVLERAILQANDFDFQTTWKSGELRAFPEHVTSAAYDVLREANYPIDASFDLWQEEARAWLEHLGVPRHELMALLQSGQPSPTDASIAGEYFGISSYELGIICNPKPQDGEQKTFWGFTESPSTFTSIRVSDFLDRSKLQYMELLELMQVKWISEFGGSFEITPKGSLELSKQKLGTLSLLRLDRIHRFLRLWRKTSWKMWELDLLIRSPVIGNGSLDATLVVKLHQFKRIQDRLGLSCEEVLALFDGSEINDEARSEAINSSKTIQPLYKRLFESRDGTQFKKTSTFDQNRPALRAALKVSDENLSLMLPQLTQLNLSETDPRPLYAWSVIARSLSLTVEELFLLMDLAQVQSFANPLALLSFIELRDQVSASGLKVSELGFILKYASDSPYALSQKSIVQMLEGLRETLQKVAVESDRNDKIVDKVATLFKLTQERAGLLLDKLFSETRSLGDILSDTSLLERDSEDSQKYIDINRNNFSDQFKAIELLHKVSFLLARQPVASIEDFKWLLEEHDDFGLMQLTELSVQAQVSVSIARWAAFTNWRALVKQFPEPENASWREVLEQTGDDIWAKIAALTQWPVEDIETIGSSLGIGSATAPVDACCHLIKIMNAVRWLGVGATVAKAWIDRDTDAPQTQQNIASQIRDTAKSKHDALIWLEKAAPIQNELREKKRTALCRYLVEHSLQTQQPTVTVKDKDGACPQGRNPKYWTDTNDLISYFLLDVEMGADQLTSRIKQAMSSVQMFVQRCFLNLEQPRVQVSPKKGEAQSNPWLQWQYMKSYRLWQAARKILLYPENWIEPELRADKSPFFEELESELAKDEMTDEHAEACFRHYMEKVHEVSRLDVVGVYRELSKDASDLRDFLHIVARTKADPAIFYYRAFNGIDATWSPWEKIDADITGEHVHPVVYNRKLYLFWLVFLEKPQKTYKQPPGKASDQVTDSPEAPKQLEIQLAWTQRKDDGWTSKTVSREKLIHPWERPLSSYQLVPRYRDESGENELWLDLFISSSKEFNDTKFYDPFLDGRYYQTKERFNESARPWHSSSFVFNGGVTGVKMRRTLGRYHMLDGIPVFPFIPESELGDNQSLFDIYFFYRPSSDNSNLKDSVFYINTAFGEAGRAIKALVDSYDPIKNEMAEDIMLPTGMHYKYNRLVNNENNNQLSIVDHPELAICPDSALPFELIVPSDRSRLLYQDRRRSFFALWKNENAGYTFFPFYHPYTALFLRELDRSGIDGLLQRKIQVEPQTFSPVSNFNFGIYQPQSSNVADKSALRECVDFDRKGAYSIYNWETFFHAPFLIACRLTQNQKFEEAMRWFHYIFDPTNVDGRESPKRFWVTKPFYEENSEGYRKQRIQALLENVGDKSNLEKIQAWRNDPFNPHLIAQHRPVAYQRAVVMRYIDNLIAWGDQLFRRDTMESINEATTLYLLAYEILGPRPIKVPDVDRAELSYANLAEDDGLDPLGNKSVLATVENFVPGPSRFVFNPDAAHTPVAANLASKVERLAPKVKKERSKPKIVAAQDARSVSGVARLPRAAARAEPAPLLNLYFRIPSNDELLGRWDLVEDRLFKIRHSMNIDGVFRQLPLFEPPIDPALLVKASAAGVDIASTLSDAYVEPGQYRFRVMLAKALEYCAEVRALGDKLLSTLEKRDAEELARLRSSHETQVLESSRQVRNLQISEAKEAIAGLEKAKQQAEMRRDFYQNREFINALEGTALALSGTSAAGEAALAIGYMLASGLSHIPAFITGASGFGGSPHITVNTVDGIRLAQSVENQVVALQKGFSALDKLASLANTMGSYQRRKEDWDHQAQIAEIDVSQIDRQIAAAELRQAIAERELENLERQIENAKTVEEYYKSKYTNQQLYDWMLDQISTVYFGSYKLAHDMALRAQNCLRFELGNDSLSFIEFGYWDSLKKGLLAGEKLSYDLRRMETAYLDQNKREFELTKHISMAEVMPMALLTLKATGECVLNLPEWLFDMDFPSHCRRRIKSVSLTIPCIQGPYSGVHATLSLTGHSIRTKENTEIGDLPISRVPITSIATSDANNDSGVFELNFNDERYLPFEGAGAINSMWTLELPKDSNHFDFNHISDIIMHVRYTAVAGNIKRDSIPDTCDVLLDLKGAFPTEWQRFQDQESGTLEFELKKEHLPFFARGESVWVSVSSSRLDLLKGNDSVDQDTEGVTPPEGNAFEGLWQIELDANVQGAYLAISCTIGKNS
jgi:peptidoglycan hydrolase-like protein with peptidoglycan-binding domain